MYRSFKGEKIIQRYVFLRKKHAKKKRLQGKRTKIAPNITLC